MAKKLCPDGEFITLFEQLGAASLARHLKTDVRSIYRSRKRLENIRGRDIVAPKQSTRIAPQYPGRIELEVRNGIILVASDAHYWPGPASTAHRGFVKFCKELKPAVVVLNGDVVDMATISRFPGNWECRPTVQEEIEAAQDRLQEITEASGKAKKIWTLGNHDARFETRLANAAPEFAKVAGVHLKDHFPLWEPCWSIFVNDDIVIKHRYKGGIHATHNNTMWAGRSIVTGHLHSAKVTPVDDYNGTRYGVDTGCLADTNHPAFEYLEDNPRNWRSAFAVLTIKDGRLLQPELCLKWDDTHMEFRGEVISV